MTDIEYALQVLSLASLFERISFFSFLPMTALAECWVDFGEIRLAGLSVFHVDGMIPYEL